MDHMKKQPNAFVRSTFIVGHPGESQEDFDALLEYIKTYKFDRANVFSYSDEDGTSSYFMDNKIDQETIDKRAEILGEAIEEATNEVLESDLGKTFDVVVNGESDEHEYFLSAKKLLWAPDIDGEILINDNELPEGEQIEFGKVYKAKITQIAGSMQVATIVS
jgi:ribosomal protein S12 methylthiotransferase